MQHSRVSRRAAIVLHAGLWVLAVASLGAAQSPEPTRAALTVRGSAGCLEQSAIESQVHDRSRRIAFVPETAGVPVLAVEAQRKVGRALAVELTVAWPDKRQSRRTLAADGCEDATSAVAFLIALTLDPQAAAQPAAGSAVDAVPDPTSSSAAASADAGASPATNTPAPGAPPAQTPQSSATAATSSRNADEDASGVDIPKSGHGPFAFDYVGLGAGAILVGGVAPSLMPGLAVHALVAFRGFGVLAPALQLTAAHAWVNGLSQVGGVADFQRSTVRLDLCPLALQSSSVTARACVSSAVGTLNAQGSQTYVPRSSARGWLDLGTSLRASAGLGPFFQVVAGVSLAFPLRRDAFEFRPDVFHRVSVPSWEGQLGLGVRFP